MSFLAAHVPTHPGARRLGPDHVTILMATFNGATRIDAQLASLRNQSHRDWSLIVSDDGSSDDTVARVRAFAARSPAHRVLCLAGPRKGSALNFLSLLRAAGPAPWVAFADQDDVWLPDRLARGVSALTGISRPAVYGSRTIITDDTLAPLRCSPLFTRPPGFSNALVQNVAGGNTMLLNRAALDTLQPASTRVDRLIAHDWWVYQMVTGMGGTMVYDPRPTVLYRQHVTNQIGANDGRGARRRRLMSLAQGRFAGWCDVQTAALATARDALTPEASRTLDAFNRARGAGPVFGLLPFLQSGIYRQTFAGSLALWAAAASGRLAERGGDVPTAVDPGQFRCARPVKPHRTG